MLTNTWTFGYRHFDPASERLREALCTIGNGYFATRGAAPETAADEHHYPGTYVAGCYNRRCSEIAGQVVENESLVNLPNWLPLKFRIDDGDWLSPDELEIVDYRQILDVGCGILRRALTCRDSAGRETRLEQARLAHLRRIHLAALESRIVARNWSGRIELLSALDGRVVNDGVARYRDLERHHLEPALTRVIDRDTIALHMVTNDSRIYVAEAARTRLYRRGQALEVTPEIDQEDDYIAQRFSLEIEPEVPIVVEKTLALHTSRDSAIYTPDVAAGKSLIGVPRFEQLADEQSLLWAQLWRRFVFELEHVDPEIGARTSRILQLHLFHLLQVSSPATMDLDVGVPARGLHGEAYRGHVFWDELFVFPLLNLRIPNITRALLSYRFRRLDEARRAARAAGHAGAMYPWQSGSSGREESQRLHLNPRSGRWIPDHSRLQRHVNSAIAYNVWQYYQVTRDREFLAFYGAEMMLEIARFWASVAQYNDDRQRYEIRKVVGPDEYHDAYADADEGGVDNNAYTNVMAVWVLCRALELPEALGEQRWRELSETLEIGADEVASWNEISRKMYVPLQADGIVSQFEGYAELEEFDWQGYREKYGDIQRLDRILEAEGDTPNRYKASKQADVLMLFYLLSAETLEALFQRLGYAWEYETIPRNVEYYLERTSHGSSLSRIVHSWVLARRNREGAWQLFCDALESDVSDIQNGSTSEGIHVGAMAGTVDLMQRCFTGIETREDVLWLNPCLPDSLERLALEIHYRQQPVRLEIDRQSVSVTTEPSAEAAIRVGLGGEVVTLHPGDRRSFSLDPLGPNP